MSIKTIIGCAKRAHSMRNFEIVKLRWFAGKFLKKMNTLYVKLNSKVAPRAIKNICKKKMSHNIRFWVLRSISIQFHCLPSFQSQNTTWSAFNNIWQNCIPFERWVLNEMSMNSLLCWLLIVNDAVYCCPSISFDTIAHTFRHWRWFCFDENNNALFVAIERHIQVSECSDRIDFLWFSLWSRSM